MSSLYKSAVVNTFISQESNIGMGSISKIMVKEEGKTEVGGSITSDTAFEDGRGVKVCTIETRIHFSVQEVWNQELGAFANLLVI